MQKPLTQGAEIEAICRRLGITRDELAERVPMKPETLRKVAHGYQPASARTMQQIRNVAEMARLLQAAPRAPAGSPYRFMKLETLQQNFAEVAGRLGQTAGQERRHILSNLRGMLEELEERDLGAAASETVAASASALLKKGASSVPGHSSGTSATVVLSPEFEALHVPAVDTRRKSKKPFRAESTGSSGKP